jgi:hypothetical protein
MENHQLINQTSINFSQFYQRALLLVPYDDTTSPPTFERPDSKISIDKRLSSIETDIREIKEILKVK